MFSLLFSDFFLAKHSFFFLFLGHFSFSPITLLVCLGMPFDPPLFLHNVLFWEGFVRSNGGMMLLSEVCPIRESSNDDLSHCHNGSNTTSDHVSSVPAGDVVAANGMTCHDVDVASAKSSSKCH